MHLARKMFATSMIAAAGAVAGALALSAPAAADPAPMPLPPMPNLPVLQQFLNPATAPQLLQGLASAFQGTAAPTAAAVAPAPTASAELTLPQPGALTGPLAINDLAGALPAAAPADPLVPTAEVNIPQMPGAAPLPQQMTFPGNLASLLPPGTPLAGLLPTSPAPAATAPGIPAAATPGLEGLAPLVFPTSALP